MNLWKERRRGEGKEIFEEREAENFSKLIIKTSTLEKRARGRWGMDGVKDFFFRLDVQGMSM